MGKILSPKRLTPRVSVRLSLQAQPKENSPAKRFLPLIWVAITFIIGPFTTALLQGPVIFKSIRDIPYEYSKTSRQFLSWLKSDDLWKGYWNSSPDVVNASDMNLTESDDVQVSIYAQQGHIDGMITSKSYCESFPVNDFFLLRGRVSGSVAHVEVFDFVFGREIIFSNFDLVMDDGVIEFAAVKKGGISWIKNGIRLGKNYTITDDAMSGYCKGKRNAKLLRRP